MCVAQFKSGYVVADMLRATENYQIKIESFSYFESHEVKSCSDSIGSIVKFSFTKGMLKSQQAVCNIDTHWLSSRMSRNNPPRNLIFS